MELSFAGVNSVEAGYLVQELELALLKAGAPAKALSLKRSSPENMDLGTILGVNVDTVLHAIGGLGYIACFAKCIHEVASKHHVTVVINTSEGTIKIPAAEVKAEVIEKAIALTKVMPKA